jgi:hypothetical protein
MRESASDEQTSVVRHERTGGKTPTVLATQSLSFVTKRQGQGLNKSMTPKCYIGNYSHSRMKCNPNELTGITIFPQLGNPRALHPVLDEVFNKAVPSLDLTNIPLFLHC